MAAACIDINAIYYIIANYIILEVGVKNTPNLDHSIECSTGGVKNTRKGSEITPNEDHSLGVILKKSEEHPNLG